MTRPHESFYEKAASRPIIIHAICVYLRRDECRKCPEWETHDDGEKYQRACFGLAEEAVALVLEDDALRRGYENSLLGENFQQDSLLHLPATNSDDPV